jgi:hypothetical protein
MSQIPQVGRRCTAQRKDGSRCRQLAISGSPDQLCAYHAGASLPSDRSRRNLQHGFHARDDGGRLEYLRRVSPAEFVRGRGLALQERPLGVREREIDLHPIDPEQSDANTAIAGLLHKMEILDALIFRAREHGLDITTLLALYLQASTRLGHLLRERYEMSSAAGDDLLRLLERANAELEKEQGWAT